MEIYTLSLNGTTFYSTNINDIKSQIPKEIEIGDVYEVSRCYISKSEYLALVEFDGF